MVAVFWLDHDWISFHVHFALLSKLPSITTQTDTILAVAIITKSHRRVGSVGNDILMTTVGLAIVLPDG
jgi:hypothetical protein